MVSLEKNDRIIPTYIPKKANDLPMFFENKPYQGASGRLYPLPYSDGITDEKSEVSYEVYTLENEYVKTDVLPALGGKILRGYDKLRDYDFIYYNEVVKPALVGLAGSWISGGIEFNFPQHHRPTTFMPLEAAAEENEDGGKTVWVGETEPFNRMKGMAGITVDEGRSYIKAKVRVYNRTAYPQVFMWWANLAVPVNKDYRTVFPPDVEWVNDHDRRAVLSWPMAKGLYKTARPYDFGEGTDLSRYDAVKVPSSYLISQGQSDMDFVSGYDTGKKKGIATVANHHIAPGKKMWHWGIGDFGDMWCSNLTDENGPYIELMTGVFTDNQPDFTWIAPYETKEFEQYWYPVHDIGEIKNASIDAALNLEDRGDSKAYLGLNATGTFKNAKIVVTAEEKVLFETVTDLNPRDAWETEFSFAGADYYDVDVKITDEKGHVLIGYKPYKRGQKKPIEVRKPAARPSEIESTEELYLNGLHLEQYKQHNYKPEDYYLEALSRDPGDARCNTGMARLSLKNGRFGEAVQYAEAACKRLTIRNEHPTDTEAFYLKGLALRFLGREKEACDSLYRAAWSYAFRSSALFELAKMDCRKGTTDDLKAALQKLSESIGLNKGHTEAVNTETAVKRHLGRDVSLRAVQAYADDRLDLFAKFELLFALERMGGNEAPVAEEIRAFAKKPENVLDVVISYMNLGFYDDALTVLDFMEEDYPLAVYYKAYLRHLTGRETEALKELGLAAGLTTGYCFPNRLEDIAVLRYAVKTHKKDANACYYLGSLFYDRFRYDEAGSLWEEGVKRNPKHGKNWRNLALWYFDKKNEPEKARLAMEKALAFKSEDPRLLMEYQQLLKNMNASVEERLGVYEKFPWLLAGRDDCYLDRLTLVSQTGDYETAIEMARVKRFHIYEGGEGKLTKQHAWMHVLYALSEMDKGDFAHAEALFKNGVNMPKSYGEAKTFFNQEAHIFYGLGVLYEKEGKERESREAFEKAGEYKAAVSEISAFRALALKKAGREEEARAVLSEMHAAGRNFIVNKDLRTYYGVGSPSPMPFEYNIEKQNLKAGYTLEAFAYLAEGERDTAETFIEKAAALDPNDFSVYAYREVTRCKTLF